MSPLTSPHHYLIRMGQLESNPPQPIVRCACGASRTLPAGSLPGTAWGNGCPFPEAVPPIGAVVVTPSHLAGAKIVSLHDLDCQHGVPWVTLDRPHPARADMITVGLDYCAWAPPGTLVREETDDSGTSGRVQTLPSVADVPSVLRWVRSIPYSKAGLAAELLLDVLSERVHIPLQLADVLTAVVYELRQTAHRTRLGAPPPPPAPAVPPEFPPPVPDRTPYRVEKGAYNCYAIVGDDDRQVAHTGQLDLAEFVVAALNGTTS